jgi:hypothetical protein
LKQAREIERATPCPRIGRAIQISDAQRAQNARESAVDARQYRVGAYAGHMVRIARRESYRNRLVIQQVLCAG